MRRTVFLVGFTSWLVIAAGIANAATVGTLVTVSGPTPFSGCTLADPGGGTLYPGTEVETHLAVNPANPNDVVGTWQQDRWSNGAARGSATAVSTDGGATWTRGVVPGITVCSGGTDFTRASDPWLTFSPNGTAYQMSLVATFAPAKTGFGSYVPSGMSVSRSTDGGLTWGPPTFVAYETDPKYFDDKNTITADPFDSNRVYAVWDQLQAPQGKGSISSSENSGGATGPTMFTRTTDGGATWAAPRAIFNQGTQNQTIGNEIVVLPNGTLVNLFDLIRNNNKLKTQGYNLAVIRSTDHGTTWDATATIAAKMRPAGVSDPDTGTPVRTGAVIPHVAVDPASGAIYAVWTDARWGAAHIAFTESTDGGLTWSAPVRIDGAPLDVQSFVPSITVGANGRVGVTFYDFRNNTADPGLPVDVWFTTCASSCTNTANWDETRVTATSRNMENAPYAGGYFVGDYQGLAASGTGFRALFAVPGATASSTDVLATTIAP